MSKEQFLSEIEQIVREWNGLERGHLESALKVVVMRNYQSEFTRGRLQEANWWHEMNDEAHDEQRRAQCCNRVAELEAEGSQSIEQPVVPVPAIVEVEGLRELIADWRETASMAKDTDFQQGEAEALSMCALELEDKLAAAAPQSGEGKKG